MSALLRDALTALGVDDGPVFLTADHRHGEVTSITVVAIVDVVMPPETLLTTAPVLVFHRMALIPAETLDGFPYRGQTLLGQYHHKLPAILKAGRHQRAIGI